MSTSDPHEELLRIADSLEDLSQRATAPEVKEPLERLEEAATRLGRAWSGSCLGYHARIYYKDLKPPPPGAHFSPEWGMQESWPIEATTGDWIEYDPDEIERAVRAVAGNPDLGPARHLAATAESSFQSSKPDILSILTTALADRQDAFIASLREQVEETAVPSRAQVLGQWLPSGPLMSRDSLAVSQGRQAPPHLSVLPFRDHRPQASTGRLRPLGSACAEGRFASSTATEAIQTFWGDRYERLYRARPVSDLEGVERLRPGQIAPSLGRVQSCACRWRNEYRASV